MPTARFAQPIGDADPLSDARRCPDCSYPIDALPPALRVVARVLPLTYAVSLLRGIWHGEGWIAHATDVGALLLMLTGFVAVSSKVFRWE